MALATKDINDIIPSTKEVIPMTTDPTPQPKVIAAALAGASTTLILFILSQYMNLDLPGEVGAAITALLSFVFGYVTSNK